MNYWKGVTRITLLAAALIAFSRLPQASGAPVQRLTAPQFSAVPIIPRKLADVTQTRDVSFRTALDRDGDGLTNAEEAVYGTNPDRFDSDPNPLMPGGFGDGFGDGVEAVNPAFDGNPLDSGAPGPGNMLYQLGYTRWVTTGPLETVISPAWSIRRYLAFIRTNSNFTSGAIYVQDTSDLSFPSTGPLVTNLSPELREICFGPLGNTIIYHRRIGTRDRILEVPITGGTPELVLLEGTTSPTYSVRNPALAFHLEPNYSTGDLETSGSLFLIGETDNPSASNGQLFAFELFSSGPDAGRWNSSRPVRQITNFPNHVARPKVSRDGDKIMFVVNPAVSVANLFFFKGLKDILSGTNTTPYTIGDLRGDYCPRSNGVKYPGGFGGSSNVIYWVADVSESYSYNSLDFSGSNFDIFCAAIGMTPSGRFGIIAPGAQRIPLPGNQIQISPTRRGGSFAIVDDYLSDGNPGGQFNLLWSILESKIRVVANNTGALYKFTHPDGTEFTINTSTAITYGLTPESCLSISNLPSEVGSTTHASIVTALRNYLPHGTTFADPVTTGGMLGVISWEAEDLWTRAGILDESRIKVMRYNEALGIGEDTLPWQRRNGRRISFTQNIFSPYGLDAPVIAPTRPASAQHWELYR